MKTSKARSILLSVCELIVGILLLIDPIGFTGTIIVFLGIALSILGIVNIVQYFRDPPAQAILKQSLAHGCLELAAGIFFVVKSTYIASLSLLTVLYGVGILILGITKVQWTVDQIRLKTDRWFLTAISAALTILCAVIILCNPTVVWTLIAVFLILEAVMDIVAAILTRKRAE